MKKFLMGFFIIFLLLILLYPLGQTFMHEKSYVSYKVHYVSQGETIWSIAREYPHGDLNEFIYDIRKINKLDNCIIVPGQEILIPSK